MKKIFITVISLFLLTFLTLGGCKSPLNLCDSVVELKQEVFMGKTDNYTLKATYGYKTDALNKKVYTLFFVLFDKETDNVSRTVSVDFNGTTYSSKFSLNPVTNHISAGVEIENFNLKTFSARIITGSKTDSINLSSVLPDNTLDYQSALSCLQTEQPSLINNYLDGEGKFTGSIALRIVVKDDKPYWYVGLTDKSGKLKALLLDGVSGKVLAIRDVF